MLRLIALLALLLWPALAAAQDNPIVQRMAQFVEVYNRGDAAGVAQFYTQDAVLLPPGQASVQGREAIAAHYAAAFAQGVSGLQARTFDITAEAQQAVEIGETVVMAGGRRIVGRYMHLWVVRDGALLLHRDMYHVLSIE